MRVAVCDNQPFICREVEQHLRDFDVQYHYNMEISVFLLISIFQIALDQLHNPDGNLLSDNLLGISEIIFNDCAD